MMESRREQLSQLRDFIKEADKEVTLILQSLQWDKNTLIQAANADSMTLCKYDPNHRIPIKIQKEHEKKCYLKSQGYKDDLFLPEPLDPDAKTLVQWTSDEIRQIIDTASKNDPLFKRVFTRINISFCNGTVVSEPLTLGRIEATYTTDERRAIHDAVVNTVPSFHDLSDLALPSSNSGASGTKAKSRLEVLAELRDMRRRRARYRVSAPAKNYSITLRELIATQMELYTGSSIEIKSEQSDQKTNKTQNNTYRYKDIHMPDNEKYNKGNVRENFKDREHYIRNKDKYSNKERYSDKRERETSYSKDRDRRYNRHDDRKRRDKYSDSYSDDRNSTSRDKRRHESERDRQYRERKEDKYRRDEKVEYIRYYDIDNRHEKQGRHISKEKSRHKEYKY